MAAVTVNSKSRTVQGNRVIKYYNVDIASDGDTLDTNLKSIKHVTATSQTNNAIGYTESAGVITFQTAGAESGVSVEVVATN